EVVVRISPGIVIGLALAIAYPAVEHTSLFIKSVFFAIDGLGGNGAFGCAVASLISLAVCLEIVPVVIRLVFLAGVLILNGNPLIGYHGAGLIYIIVVIVVFNQLINGHFAIFIQPEPVVSGFFPLFSGTFLVPVVVHPGSI